MALLIFTHLLQLQQNNHAKSRAISLVSPSVLLSLISVYHLELHCRQSADQSHPIKTDIWKLNQNNLAVQLEGRQLLLALAETGLVAEPVLNLSFSGQRKVCALALIVTCWWVCPTWE